MKIMTKRIIDNEILGQKMTQLMFQKSKNIPQKCQCLIYFASQYPKQTLHTLSIILMYLSY